MNHTILAQTEHLARVASSIAGRCPQTALRISHLSKTAHASCVVTYCGPGVTYQDLVNVAASLKSVTGQFRPKNLAVTADVLPGDFPFSVPVFYDVTSTENVEIKLTSTSNC